jgi:carbamate kinase
MSAGAKQLVVALGGNAISAPDRQGTIGEQFAQTEKTAGLLCDAIIDGDQLVPTHGNGSIPVYLNESGRYQGAAAVIDKDLTTVLLAQELGIATVVILTAVEYVYLDYGKPSQKALRELTLAEAEQHLEAGQFGDGSMGPKIGAAIEFLKHSQDESPQIIIAELGKFSEALAGTSGTRITR